MKTKKFYTVAELAEMFYIIKTNVDLAYKCHKKYPDDEKITYLLQHAYNEETRIDLLLEKLNAVDIVLDYYDGINRTTGNKKLYL